MPRAGSSGFSLALLALLLLAWPAFGQHISTFAGGGVGELSPALNGLLINPSHLAVDRFNNLHVSDRGGHRILKITPAGVISTVMGTGFPGRLDIPGGFRPPPGLNVNSPSGIAFRPTPFNFDPAVDELIFADTGNHWILAVDTVTATEPVAYREMGTSFQGYCCDNFNVFADFDTPQGLAVDANGNVFIADTNNHIVRRLNWHNYQTSPTIDRVAGIPQQAGSTGDGDQALLAKLQHPRAVAFDAAGDLYIAESHRIRKVNMATGVISTLVGSTTAGFNGDGTASAALLLDTPTDLKVGPDGNLYFVDSGNYRVRRIAGGAVQTVAGTGATGDSGDGLAATAAGLAGPRGIVFNQDGHLFVTMYNSGKIRRIEAGTNVITTYAGGAVVQPNGGSFAGDGGLARGLAMNSPGGATPHSDGSVYLADAFNHRVRKVDGVTGIVSTIAGNGTPGSTGDAGLATSATLNTPLSVAVDGSGNRYIAESNGGRVRKIDAGGSISTFALLTAPTWVVARGADVYIADGAGNRIVKVTAGIQTTVAGTGAAGSTGDDGPATAATLDFPAGFVFDAAGNLFIAEAGGNRVRKVTTGGTISTVAGTGTAGFAGDGGPATAAQLDFPMGVEVDDAGALYIVDGNNHRIRKVLSNGTIKTMAGNGTPGFGGDGGDSPGATLNQPSFITRDTAGRLYLADTDNHRVRRINPRIPFAPTLGTLTPASGQITVAFTAPADDGNAVIVEYGVECHGPIAVGQAGTSSPIVVSGLTPGSYGCFAYARNSAGWGEATAMSSPVTVGTAPSIASPAPAGGTVGAAYTHTYSATGSPTPTFSVQSGSLPPGLSLSSGGVISGTPTDGGVFAGVVAATNGVAPDATQAFSITIAKLTTSVTLASNANPSVVGASVTFTATLGGTATGTIAFKDGASTISGCGAVAVSSLQAACTTSALAIGMRSITAEYGGSAQYAAAASGALGQAVKPLAPAITSPAAASTAPPNPTVSGTGTSGATVTVREGASTVCTTSVNGSGAWSCPTTLAAGSRTIDAVQELSGQTSAASASVTFTVSLPSHMLTVTRTGAGTGTVTGNGGFDCGTACSVSYLQGTVVTLTATPANGSSFGGWSSPCSGTGSCIVTMDTAKSLAANFGIAAYQVTPSAGPGGTIVPPNPQPVSHGQTYTFTVTAQAGYTASVGGTCGGALVGTTYTTNAVTGNCTVAATFTQNTYTVTPVAGAGGSISPNTPQTVAHGATRTFTVVPSAGHVTTSVTGCGGAYSQGSSSYTTAPITGNCTVTVAFASLGSDMGTTIAANPTTANVGQDVTFTVTLSSSGPESGAGVSTWIVVPAGATFVSASQGCNPATLGPQSIVVCSPGTVAIGATPSFTFVLRPTVAGTLTVNATVSSGTWPDPVAGNNDSSVSVTVATANPPRLGNISTRSQVLTGDDVMIAGLVIGGSANKTVVVRARGPSLADFGIVGFLPNPRLQLFSGPTVIASNDNWGDAANAAQVTASGFAPAHANEAAILMNLAPGAYSAVVSGVGNTTGVSIVEVFEVDAIEVPLLNIATRSRVQTGDNVLIAGIVVQGSGPQQVVIRARGPSLADFGIVGFLPNPKLQIFSGPTVIAENDDWQQAGNAAAIQSSGFAPAHANESAVLMTLQPGAYTAIVSGVGGSTGVAIVEVFRY